MTTSPAPLRDPAPMLARTMAEWGGQQDLWVFGYGSLIWRPEFPFVERHPARVHGWHRALKMWSRVNRGTPECPGLVWPCCLAAVAKAWRFASTAAGGAHPAASVAARNGAWGVRPALAALPHHGLWRDAGHGARAGFHALAPQPKPHRRLTEAQYRHIFAQARGIYGSTHDYARATYDELRRLGIHDRALGRLLAYAAADGAAQ